MKQNTFLLQLKDKQGKVIENATIKGRFLHPSNSKRDITFELKQVEPGLYAIDLIMPVGGRWDLYLQIWNGELYYESQSHTVVNSR
jgi:nitrogen fixation protein FixH